MRLVLATASLLASGLASETVAAETGPDIAARNTTTRTPCDQMGRIVAKTTRYRARRTTVDFRLKGGFPFQRYSYEVEFTYVINGIGTAGNYIGVGTTNRYGNLSLNGTGFPRRTTARYTVSAESAVDSCRARGVVRPAR